MEAVEADFTSDAISVANEQYIEGIHEAEQVMRRLLRFYSRNELANRDGWKKKNEYKGDVVYAKKFDSGLVFTLRVELDYKVDTLFNDHWNDIEDSKNWNPNIEYVQRVEQITPTCDILKYALNDMMVVKGREFLVCRVYRKIGDDYFVAAHSFNTDLIPPSKAKVRATLHLGGGRFSPHPTDPNKSVVDYLLSLDFCMRAVPSAIINTCIANVIMQDSVNTRKHIQQKKDDGEWQ